MTLGWATARAPAAPAAERRAEAKAQARAAAKRERDQERLEEEIATKERELAALSAVINTPDFYRTHDSPQQVFSQYAQLKRDVDVLYSRLDRLEQA